ncbi:E3 ubiquitin-protein ligase TRIM71 [Geodia barretti]|uniref:E3 ubiquitin-protein ligase TRIM71 n=1 Tax=Geodia barretti TaxID=519541 RepID=A0AA35SUS2_GEOBA|nr:E3 ubiquitin-protein ligase TRIM71 [Geodia barretti]
MANKALDDTLTPDDAVEVLEELLPAQNESYALGLKFKLPQSDVQGIHDTYSKPRNRLLQILIEFFKQTEPKPSWRVIVEALRSPAVNQSALAAKVESARPHHLEAAVETDPSMNEVRSRVLAFRQRFNVIKQATIKRLIACQVTVASMVFWLTSIRVLGEHRVFLEENLEALGQCPNHWVLFGRLNLYWNYLAYDLLFQLIEVLATEYDRFRTISEDMAEYKEDLEGFKRNTPLKLFCKAEPMPFSQQDTPPPGFQEMVGEFNWSKNVTLEEVEQFQKRYARKYNARKYNLEDCAMIVNSIRPGSFVVTWFVPVSIIRLLSQETDRAVNLFEEFEVTRLEIAGNCVYHSSFQKVAPSLPFFTMLWNLLFNRRMHLSVRIFYHNDNTATFVVTKNLPTHIAAVKQTIAHTRVEDIPISCESTTNSIVLSLPKMSKGWYVTSHFEPAEIETLDINTYAPGKSCPKIILCMEWKGSDIPKEERKADLIRTEREVALARENLDKVQEQQLQTPCSQSDTIVAIVGRPYGVDFFKQSEKMIVSGWDKSTVFCFDDKFNQTPLIKDLLQPADIATDRDDNIYVTSKHKLQKFTSSGVLKAKAGDDEDHNEKGKFNDPRGITMYENQVYVCDRNNHRIQVFDLDLHFVKSIGSYGDSNGELDAPYDVKFDNDGNMYIVELGNRRVQVMNTDGQFIRMFGQKRVGNIGLPTGLHVDKDKNIVYISDFANDRM